MTEDAKSSARCKAKGVINFPPFEALDEAALREVRRFQVHPFGSIQDTCRRIPYNSGKKDFYSKTGREFFEGRSMTSVLNAGLTTAVFQYEFRIPGDDTLYTIMWDYSVGLVRMTPFFKCRGYSKVRLLSAPIQRWLTQPDHPGKDAQPEPRPQRHHIQHHRRRHQGTGCVLGTPDASELY
jgi:hypothetical protein